MKNFHLIMIAFLAITGCIHGMEKHANNKEQALHVPLTAETLTLNINALYKSTKPFQEYKPTLPSCPNMIDQYFVHAALVHSPTLSLAGGLLDYQKKKFSKIQALCEQLKQLSPVPQDDTRVSSCMSIQGPTSHLNHPEVCINTTVPNRLQQCTGTHVFRHLSPCSIALVDAKENTIQVQTTMDVDKAFKIIKLHLKDKVQHLPQT